MADEAPQDAAPTTGSDQSRQQEPARLSQEDVDRIVKERLERQRQQFKDYDDLKAKAAKLDELEESRKTEAEKLLGAVEKYKGEAQAASEREQQAVARARDTLVRAAVVSEAARQRAIDPDAVIALLDRSQIQIDDDGNVQGVEGAVKSLLEQRSYLVGRPQGGFDGGARITAPVENTREDFNAQLRRMGGFGT